MSRGNPAVMFQFFEKIVQPNSGFFRENHRYHMVIFYDEDEPVGIITSFS